MRRRLSALALCGPLLLPFSFSVLPSSALATPSHPKAHKAIASKAAKPAQRSTSGKKTRAKKTIEAMAGTYAARSDVGQWIENIAPTVGLPPQWMQQQMAHAHRLPLVEQLILPAAAPSAKNWAAYRARFIEPRRIEAGLAFWNRYRNELERAQNQYGIPAAIVVGILGVETLYGQNTGQFRVLDALSTLAFDFPQAHPRAQERQAFFRKELAEFLRMAHDNGGDPRALRGSYAGAMGWPQFMPSSWSHFAVDFDGDGRIDLINSPIDAIGSVANYFKAFNWQPGMPTHYPVSLPAGQVDMDALLAPDILPTFSVGNFMAKGAVLEGAALQHKGPLALIELRNGEDAPSYVAGTDNFYAITRYNWSSYYAMAVIELGQAVAERVAGKR